MCKVYNYSQIHVNLKNKQIKLIKVSTNARCKVIVGYKGHPSVPIPIWSPS